MSSGGEFVSEHSMTARCSADEMMARLLDAGQWPAWQPEIVSTEGPERVGPGDVVSGRARMLGFGVQGRSIALHVGPTSFEEDVVVGVALRVRYEVRPEGDRCVVVHRIESDLPGGPMGRLLAFFLRGRLRRMQKMAVARLVAQSEAGSRS